jgi:hypothetical protein
MAFAIVVAYRRTKILQNATMKPVIIYALFDKDNQIRWVGKSVQMRGRFNRHKQDRPWVIRYEVLELANDQNWIQREMFWIAHGRKVGWPLENKSAGGEGSHGYTPSDLWRQRMSRIMRGRKYSPEHCAALKAAWVERKARGWHFSPETLKKLSLAHKGIKLTPEHRQNLSVAKTGVRFAQEVYDRIGLANRGKKRSDAFKAAVSRFQKGRKRTPEQVAAHIARQTGAKRSPQGRENIRRSQQNRSAEWRKRIGDSHRGKKLSPESIAKRSATVHANHLKKIETERNNNVSCS